MTPLHKQKARVLRGGAYIYIYIYTTHTHRDCTYMYTPPCFKPTRACHVCHPWHSEEKPGKQKNTWLWVKNRYPTWLALVNGNVDRNLRSISWLFNSDPCPGRRVVFFFLRRSGQVPAVSHRGGPGSITGPGPRAVARASGSLGGEGGFGGAGVSQNGGRCKGNQH